MRGCPARVRRPSPAPWEARFSGSASQAGAVGQRPCQPPLHHRPPLPPPSSILSIAALQRGLYTVVATSLIGSILSNLLLVLGERRGRPPAGLPAQRDAGAAAAAAAAAPPRLRLVRGGLLLRSSHRLTAPSCLLLAPMRRHVLLLWRVRPAGCSWPAASRRAACSPPPVPLPPRIPLHTLPARRLKFKEQRFSTLANKVGRGAALRSVARRARMAADRGICHSHSGSGRALRSTQRPRSLPHRARRPPPQVSSSLLFLACIGIIIPTMVRLRGRALPSLDAAGRTLPSLDAAGWPAAGAQPPPLPQGPQSSAVHRADGTQTARHCRPAASPPPQARLIYGSETISQPVLSDLSHLIAIVLIFICERGPAR